ncbi:hypothetical protein MMC19_004551 [Ptychographa xylographoides]|nr:hypothetical protein [Ptychographa xylographoides]
MLLYSLIIDNYGDGRLIGGAVESSIWNLFYHFFVPATTSLLIHSQSQKLYAMSETLVTWKSGTYGKHLHFVNDSTRQDVRRFWKQYADMSKTPLSATDAKDRTIRCAIRQMYQEKIGVMAFGSGENTGPFEHQALGCDGQAMKNYWDTGVVGGNVEDEKALENGGNGQINPLFIFSSEQQDRWAVHYATDPLKGFYLAEAFGNDTPGMGTERTTYLTLHISRMVKAAKQQFRDWCKTFSKFAMKQKIELRFLCAEVVTACLGLQRRSDPRICQRQHTYARPWSAAHLNFDGEMHSKKFHVIDSSNVVDHLGLLNLLMAARSLLHSSPTSVIYTETLLRNAEDPTSLLSHISLADGRLLGLLLQLSPVGYLLGVSTTTLTSQAIFEALKGKSNTGAGARSRLSWKIPYLGDMEASQIHTQDANAIQPSIDPEPLANALFIIYGRMFEREDVVKMRSYVMSIMTTSTTTTRTLVDANHYTRASLASLIQAIQVFITSDWDKVIELLLYQIQTDRNLLIANNSLQDLYMHLHILGVWSSDALRSPPRSVPGLMSRPRGRSSETGLLAKEDLPSVSYVCLVVPRAKLRTFTGPDTSRRGASPLHAAIRQTLGEPHLQYENTFSTIHATFGRMEKMQTDAGEDAYIIAEDYSRWRGSSDLIISFRAPTYGLLLGPRKGIRISLKVSIQPSTAMFIKELGPHMIVYEAGLENNDRVLICRDPPLQKHQIQELSLNTLNLEEPVNVKAVGPKETHGRTTICLEDSGRVKSLSCRIDFPDSSEESQALVRGNKVEVIEISPCTLKMSLGTKSSPRLVFPLPIIGSNHKIRVARKSRWIEVTVPVSTANDREGFSENPFPIGLTMSSPDSTVIPWDFIRTPIDLYPLIKIDRHTDYSWTKLMLSNVFSDKEREDPRKLKGTPLALSDLKQSVQLLLLSFVGRNPGCGFVRNFCLQREDHLGVDTIIMVENLRHDLNSQSVVLEAYVVSLTIARTIHLDKALANWVKAKPLSISVSTDEARLWKCLLPALSERCRNYAHKPTCEYKSDGIPRTTATDKSPLCSCGEGKVSDEFLADPVRRPFARYATRIAITQLFPVPYVESCFAAMSQLVSANAVLPSTTPPPSQTANGSKEILPPNGAAETGTCANCGKIPAGGVSKLKQCAKCHGVAYCNRECQVKDWQKHKKVCNK